MPSLPQREGPLDGLRGLAIGLVLLAHLYRFEPDNAAWAWLNHVCKSGWLGVDLFFALSGFLITRLLIAERGSPTRFRDFYARRALRILPAYWAYLLVVFLLIKPELAQDWGAAFLLFLQNFAIIAQGGETPWRGLDHLWSLAIEEQFYLLWPLLLYRTPAARLPLLCLAAIILAWACKLLMLQSGWPLGFYVFTLSRMDALAAGALAAVLWGRLAADAAFWRGLQPALLVLFAALAALFLQQRGFGLHRPALMVLVTSLAAPAFAGLVLAATQPARFPRLCRTLQWRPLVFLGRYSYGLYLIHLAWAAALHHELQLALATQVPANLAALLSGSVIALLSILNAVLMFHLLEAPLLRLKHHFTPDRPGRPAAALGDPAPSRN